MHPLRAGFNNYGVLLFGTPDVNAFDGEAVELLTAVGTQATIALQNASLFGSLLAEKERIVEVEEEARKKLSRDLHDGPTQSVAAIAMRVNFIRRLIERDPTQVPDELWKVEELARKTTKEIRHLLFTLRPLALESQGLVAALEQLAEKMKDTHEQNVIVQAKPGCEDLLDSHAQGVIFNIVEEAVNNARKHAQAEHIWVRLYTRPPYYVVEIQDDGVGFDVEETVDTYGKRSDQSLGLVNMHERAELVEGELHLESSPGKGTLIRVLIPLDSSHIRPQLNTQKDGA
ncbi:MAG: sensor histidine kinase [Anaerolineae bacterium]|nr:sensor histidine kinase [Anaerolineae bacterium]